MKRRSFIRIVGGAAGASTLGLEKLLAGFRAGNDIVGTVGGVPRRVLGRTGREVSIIGFPGLALMRTDQEQANRAVRGAFERGVNYFDNAPAYGRDGECEIRMGPALATLDRAKIFLSCKTKARDAEGAKQELDRSLERHQTGYFDLYQLHHLVTVDEVRRALGPGGAIETLRKARETGKIRAMGFSAHSTKAALAALRMADFDTVMFPISFAEYYIRDFGKAVIETAEERGAVVIAIKPMSMGAWVDGQPRTRDWWYRTTETPDEIATALRFSLSLKGVITGIPPSFVDLFEKAVDGVKDFRPATTRDRDQLREFARKCESLFVREDNKPEPPASASLGLPYPDRLHHPHDCMGAGMG